MNIPTQLYYTPEHEWLEIQGSVGTVGITDYAQKELGDVVFVEAPTIGSTIQQLQECGAVESVKTVSTLFSPVSGKVIEVNSTLTSHPELVNQDPYEKGWIFKMELTEPKEVEKLLRAKSYEELLATKVH